MSDEQLIEAICSQVDTLSPEGARQTVRIVREHDRRPYFPKGEGERCDAAIPDDDKRSTYERYKALFAGRTTLKKISLEAQDDDE